MITLLVVLLFVLFPILLLYVGNRHPLVDRVGAVVISYAAGLLLGSLRVLPSSTASVGDAVSSVAVPLALCLIFFSLDLRKWSKLGRVMVLALALEVVSVLVFTFVGYILFRDALGAVTGKLGGMYVGVYTGMTINMAAIADALHVSPTLYVASNTSDIVLSAVYMLFMVTVGPKVLGLVLRSTRRDSAAHGEAVSMDYSSYVGIFSRARIVPLAGALGLAIAISACGLVLTLVLPKSWGSIAAILLITTLGILASFVPRVRRIKMTYQLGQYFILVFCFAVGSMADLSKLASVAPAVFGYVAVCLFGSFALHIVLCRIFRVDRDTMIITSVATINSAPFVPMAAAALKNREIVVGGVLTGLVGGIIGTYLGLAWASFLLWVG
jgi:uncharacterized membrane protein